MAGFTLIREAAAAPEVVFDVLTDHRLYADDGVVSAAERRAVVGA